MIQNPATAATQNQPSSGIPTKAGLDDKSFVFTGNKITTPQPAEGPTGQKHATSSGKKMSGPLIMILIIVLIIVWGLFWAKFFGLI